jgi:hypothetical protein
MKEWSLQGLQFDACNCNWGCPCQFNSPPTQGFCEAVVAMKIDHGEFDGINLDGLCWAGTFAWPESIDKGNGRCQVFIDIQASTTQREALLTILSGQESDPGATVFQVFSTTISEMFEPQFVPIEFSADLDSRLASLRIPDVLESSAAPIPNPVTGKGHRAKITIPEGFEFHEAEMASGTYSTQNAIKITASNRNAMLMKIHMTGHGVVH